MTVTNGRYVFRIPSRWPWPVALSVAALAGVAYGWGIGRGTLHVYYAATVATMSSSPHAFFVGGFDPAGRLSIDKLPGAFWVQALVVRVFGLHTWCLIAPQLAAGVGIVVLVFVAVRRIVSARAGVVASIIAAATPATAVMSRGDTPDAICVLLMVVAADAAIRALRTGRLRSLIVVGIWIGLAFQAKMIEAWALLPGILLAYLVAAPIAVRVRLLRTGLVTLVTVAVSVSWMTVVSLVPAASRPYADGSRHNSVFAQVFAYNALGRFGAPSSVFGLAGGSGSRRRVDPARLLEGNFGRDAGWLLPLALFVIVAMVIALRHRPRTDIVRAAVIVWGAWLIVVTAVFSESTELLSYYTGVLVPPIAVLCGLGFRQVIRALRNRARRMVPGLAVLASVALGFGETAVLMAQVRDSVIVAGLLLGGAVALIGVVVAVVRGRVGGVVVRGRVGGVVAAFALLLVVPSVGVAQMDAVGAGAYDTPYSPPLGRYTGGLYLGVIEAHAGPDFWRSVARVHDDHPPSDPRRRAVFYSAAAASIYVLAKVPGVEVIGGYSGYIDYPSVSQLRTEITNGEIAYVITPASGDARSSDPRYTLIAQLCRTDAPQIFQCG